ncbi:LacI family DNA-binding transcriptional regulator [Companilactobacillus huachuanensis]|uniref:LacI family DNA-binding transcriptional regulator n=1 Tax=Companilactobacillus huachuanensis TaxID=2559914 RepID=A0ABW1RQG3_9LACO|nr:LacI family DNA-binding transcriptional regulator [Companilactobacillus huachuanensis]
MGKITLKDIAQETGYSISKISRAISGSGAINNDDKQKILATARKMGYKTTTVELAEENNSAKIGVLIPRFDAMLTADFIQRLNDRLLEMGFIVDYYTVEGSTMEEPDLLRYVLDHNYKAVIYKPRQVKRDVQAVINTSKTPIFSYGQVYGNCININYDNSKMMYEMTNIAINKGAHSILYVGTFKDDIEVGYKRFDGFMKAVTEHNVTYHYLESACDIDASYEMAKKMDFSNYDAVITANDKLALGVFRYLSENNIIAGKDIILSGVENYDETRTVSPSLTTVKLDNDAVVDKIVDKLDKNDFNAENQIVPYTILRRDSL